MNVHVCAYPNAIGIIKYAYARVCDMTQHEICTGCLILSYVPCVNAYPNAISAAFFFTPHELQECGMCV